MESDIVESRYQLPTLDEAVRVVIEDFAGFIQDSQLMDRRRRLAIKEAVIWAARSTHHRPQTL